VLALAALSAAAPAAVAWPGGITCASQGGRNTPMVVGANCRSYQINRTIRRYVAWLPRSATERMRRGHSAPLVVMLHGSSGTGEQFLNHSGWKEKARRKGFIAAFPTGMKYVIDSDGPVHLSTKWASYGLEDDVDETQTPPTDDVAFLFNVVYDISHSTAVDADRVYLSGFSNGGSMCMRAALELTDIFHAFGCNAGTIYDPRQTITAGHPYRPVMFTYGGLDRNLLPAAQETNPEWTEIPTDPTAAFANRAVKGLAAQQLTVLRLNPEVHHLVRHDATGFDLRFDRPVGANGSRMDFVLLDDVEHEYPRGTRRQHNNPHGFEMTDILWPYFKHAA
jgi:poly(3-hydroxybutyrate) depolymerase